MQEEIAQLEVTGESGAGLVKVTINGAHNCRRVKLTQACWKMTKRCWKIWSLRPSTMRRAALKRRKREDGFRLFRYAIAAGFKMPF